jgi:hypothetical protein
MTSRKLRNLVVVGLLLVATTSVGAEATLLELLTGFAAKETCSCVFVVGQDEAYCKDFGSPSFPTTITIDKSAKTVTSSAGISTRTARFADGAGCTLDALP